MGLSLVFYFYAVLLLLPLAVCFPPGNAVWLLLAGLRMEKASILVLKQMQMLAVGTLLLLLCLGLTELILVLVLWPKGFVGWF